MLLRGYLTKTEIKLIEEESCMTIFWFTLLKVLMSFVIPTHYLIVGIWKMEKCEANASIPIWMIAFGSIFVIDRFVKLLSECYKANVKERPIPVGVTRYTIKLVLFILLFIGFIWTCQFDFSSPKKPENDDPPPPPPINCDYWVVWSMIFSSAAFLFFAAIALCLMFAMCFCGLSVEDLPGQGDPSP